MGLLTPLLRNWYLREESNPRRTRLQRAALPTELLRHKVSLGLTLKFSLTLLPYIGSCLLSILQQVSLDIDKQNSIDLLECYNASLKLRHTPVDLYSIPRTHSVLFS